MKTCFVVQQAYTYYADEDHIEVPRPESIFFNKEDAKKHQSEIHCQYITYLINDYGGIENILGSEVRYDKYKQAKELLDTLPLSDDQLITPLEYNDPIIKKLVKLCYKYYDIYEMRIK